MSIECTSCVKILKNNKIITALRTHAFANALFIKIKAIFSFFITLCQWQTTTYPTNSLTLSLHILYTILLSSSSKDFKTLFARLALASKA